tara:strand:- start:529 stop:789 length:261 start_codon:yes stop_codon:yes gene_type:complete
MRVWRELGVGTDFQAMPIDDNAVIALARRRGGQRYLEITVSESGTGHKWRLETTRDELMAILSTVQHFEPGLIDIIKRIPVRGGDD